MKKSIWFLLSSLLFFSYSCSDDKEDEGYPTHSVEVQLKYPNSDELSFSPQADVVVTMSGKSGAQFEAKTDKDGKVSFKVVSGVYDIVATDTQSLNGKSYKLSGSKNSFSIGDDWDVNSVVELELFVSETRGILIKEIYPGGVLKDDESGAYTYDQYIILTNNSDVSIDVSKLGLTCINPYNSNNVNNKDYVNGKLFYEVEGWIPSGMAIWYLTSQKELAPGEDLVIALNNAIDNTITYSQSINYANSKYYCTYDPESGFNNAKYYSAPAYQIDPSHYLKAYRSSLGNAWVASQTSPAFFIFFPEGTTLKAFDEDQSTTSYYGDSQNQGRKKVPTEWILDGVEVYSSASADNNKRFTGAVDAGAVMFTSKQGYTLYRNVDKKATEAIKGNKEKLVYDYALGTKGSSDPSGIDAEASIKNGARIIYMDTNNSTNDFHQRSKASLRN